MLTLVYGGLVILKGVSHLLSSRARGSNPQSKPTKDCRILFIPCICYGRGAPPSAGSKRCQRSLKSRRQALAPSFGPKSACYSCRLVVQITAEVLLSFLPREANGSCIVSWADGGQTCREAGVMAVARGGFPFSTAVALGTLSQFRRATFCPRPVSERAKPIAGLELTIGKHRETLLLHSASPAFPAFLWRGF